MQCWWLHGHVKHVKVAYFAELYHVSRKDHDSEKLFVLRTKPERHR